MTTPDKLQPGEPYFLIRAQDRFAPAAIMAYGNLSNRQAECHNRVEEFVAWQKANPEKVKTPD